MKLRDHIFKGGRCASHYISQQEIEGELLCIGSLHRRLYFPKKVPVLSPYINKKWARGSQKSFLIFSFPSFLFPLFLKFCALYRAGPLCMLNRWPAFQDISHSTGGFHNGLKRSLKTTFAKVDYTSFCAHCDRGVTTGLLVRDLSGMFMLVWESCCFFVMELVFEPSRFIDVLVTGSR
ncbi:hypothetical protein BKA60DRAFT_346546 [Fusarium oxysporum]|nr:hypothetical protein BKA60DRAFT_346546 [Fusarium oxysporum]